MSAPARAGHDELVGRARELAVAARLAAAGTERARRVPRESVEALVAAGLVRTLVPERFGGYGQSLGTWFDTTVEISAGCASTGWVAALYAHYGFVAAQFPEPAQQEVFKDGPDTVLAASYGPWGQAEPVTGGYRVGGEFPYASGVDGASWVIVGSLPPGVTDRAAARLLLIRPGQYTVRDTWQVTGLRGTGSNTVVLDNVFVPAEHTMGLSEKIAGTAAGAALHGGIFQLPMSAYNGLTFLGPMLGAGRGALRDFVRSVAGRDRSYAVEEGAGRASARLDLAESLIRRRIADADAGLAARPGLDRARSARDWSACAGLITEAVDELYALAGTRAQAEADPLQRAWRDVHAAASHHALAPHRNLSAYGRLLLAAGPDNAR